MGASNDGSAGDGASTHPSGATFAILIALSVSHLLNDTIQSIISAVYPILKTSYDLSFTEVGLITLVFQGTASLLQPLVGMATDRRPRPYSLPVGMGVSLVGLLLLAAARDFATILVAAGVTGVGSAIFHPEASRVARLASGGRHGLAQSLFQVGGNFGSALGPLLAAFIVVPYGQNSIAWFSAVALVGMGVLAAVGVWYRRRLDAVPTKKAQTGRAARAALPRSTIATSLTILIALVFSKYFYMASLTSYYTFYLMETFHISEQQAMIYLFVFLGAVAVGTFAGGPVGDRFGFKTVIWGSILGVLPFTLVLPYVNLFWTVVLSVPIGLILASAFSAIVVYAQELTPNRVGAIAGLFFGLAFGMSGLGAAVLGWLADKTSIGFVYHLCSYLPLIGLLTIFLPNLRRDDLEPARAAQAASDVAGSDAPAAT